MLFLIWDCLKVVTRAVIDKRLKAEQRTRIMELCVPVIAMPPGNKFPETKRGKSPDLPLLYKLHFIIYGQIPRFWYDTAILLIAPIMAALRKVSIFGLLI